MSAGQANVPQRKLLAGPGQTNVQNVSANATNDGHMVNMIDTYQGNASKKGNRGGSRGVTPTNQVSNFN